MSIDFQTGYFQAQKMSSKFSWIFRGTALLLEFSHKGKLFKSLAFNKVTALSTWEICSECRPIILTSCMNSLVLISIPIVSMHTLLRFHLLFPQISGNLTVPWITGCSRKRAVSNLSFKAANGFPPVSLVRMPLRKLLWYL